MKARITAILITCLFTATNFAQNSTRTSVWYFGRNAGINFNTNPPTPLTDGVLNIWEGCATICDTLGNLLIYTDGIKIWNKNHQVIPNATNLGGNNSATQSGIIVPMPGAPNLLYVFSVDAEGGSGGLRYAIVDMNLNSGLGGLVSSQNILLSRSTEKITAVQHCDKSDFWIIGHELNSNNFDVWKLTNTGISSAPQVISIGTPHKSGNTNAIGYLKSAPDGSKLALAVYGGNFFEFFDFDNSTGIISNPITLTNSQFRNPYGVEFSPDSKLLYVAGTQTTPLLWQYNVSLPTAVDIQNSLTLVTKGTSSYFGAIQLAPDGKIYVAKDNSNYLSVINSPNIAGTGCGFSEDNFYLAGKKSGLGLPNLIPSFFAQTVTVNLAQTTDFCSGTTELTATSNAKGDMITYEWYVDGNLIPQQNSNTLTVQNSGDYKVRILVYAGCQGLPSVYEKSVSIVIQKHLSATSTNTSICEGQIYEGYRKSGTYNDTFKTINGCDSIRTLYLTVEPRSFATVSQTLCEGQSYDGHTQSGSYMDTFVAANGCDSIRVLHLTIAAQIRTTISTSICEGDAYEGYTIGGTFIDTFTSANGCDSIRTLQLSMLKKSYSNLLQTICYGRSYEGHSASGTYIDTFRAANGCDSLRTLTLTVSNAISQTIDTFVCRGHLFEGYTSEGFYTDTFTTSGGCDSVRIIHLSVIDLPKPDLGATVMLCRGDTLHVSPGKFTSYVWQDLSVNAYYTVKQAGTYHVTVTNSCGEASSDLLVKELICNIQFPTAFSPNGDGRNDIFKAVDAYDIQNYHLCIYDRWGRKVFETYNTTEGWTGIYKGQFEDQGTYVWYCTFVKNGVLQSMKNTIVLVR